jgi:RHS repeat-associated protein
MKFIFYPKLFFLFCLMTGYHLAAQTTLQVDAVINQYTGQTDVKAFRSITLKPLSLAQPFQVPNGSNFRASIQPLDQYLNAGVSNQNFIKSESALTTDISLDAAAVNQKVLMYQYFDGLGRPVQTIDVKGSPGYNDLIMHEAYDQFGRKNRQFLSYTSLLADGLFKATAATDLIQFYNPSNTYNNAVKTDAAPFSATLFEASPLNRPLQQGAPGSVWQPDIANPIGPNNKAIKFDYLTNLNGTLTDQEQLIIWKVVSNLPVNAGYYGAGSLYIKVTKDEENRQVREYMDKEGHTILKKVQYVSGTAATNNDAHWAITYYVHDDFGLLRFVMPPELTTRITSGITPALLGYWAFQYQYDARHRMIVKKVPGADSVEMVYDKYDRLVLSRDGNQKAINKWFFNKYDALNRPIMVGEMSSSSDRATMQGSVDVFYATYPSNRFESPTTSSIGYSLTSTYPISVGFSDLFTINYYDDYSFKINVSLGTTYDFLPISGFATLASNLTTGLMTGNKTRILGSSNWLVATSYYDDRGRLLQTIHDDHKGNKNRVTNEYYGITNWVTKTKQEHGALLVRLTEIEYDHRGRVLKTFSTIDSSPRTLLASNKYNDVGQLVEKNIHSTDNGSSFLQSSDYRYNIRGWMTHINNSQLANDGVTNNDSNDLYGMQLLYNDVAESVNGTNTTPKYNGNIAAMKWTTNNLVDAAKEKIYSFAYDPLNRLATSSYASKTAGLWTGDGGSFDENLSYDRNGNISSLNRWGWFAGAKQQIDQLNYEYKGGGNNSNQLVTVTDGSLYYQGGKKDVGFTEYTHVAGIVEMDYDLNGNMKYDLNKNITEITYNHLNLPTFITISGGKSIEYTYDALGTKLKYKAIDNGVVVKESDYIGGIQYEAGQLAFVMTGEGRAMKKTNGWEYEYHLKDHLGNTRVAFGNLQDVVSYTATMESEKAATEEYEQNSTTGLRHVLDRRDGLYNHTIANKDMPTPSKSAWLNGSLGREVGPGKSIAVSSGDKLKMEVYAWYNATSGSTSDVVASLVSAVTTSFNITAGENLVAYNGMNNYLPSFTDGIAYTSGQPKAYINYILFDANYLNSQFGYVPMPAAAANGWQKLNLEVTVPTNGYAYVWVSNESNYNVFFDDLKIVHEKTTSSLKVVQAQDYYPFGLTFNSYSRENSTPNQYKYNGKEEQDELSLGWLDYGARMYMPEIGRWYSIDPHADSYTSITPYNYVYNNPVNFVDPDGRDGVVSGSGTADDPYVITANYYYYGLNDDQSAALQSAISQYNNGGNSFKIKNDGGEVHVSFNLTATAVGDRAAAIEAAGNDTFEGRDGRTYRFGNIVNIGEASGDEAFGSANNREITLDTDRINSTLSSKPGGNIFEVMEGTYVHEIGHNLAGNHGDTGTIMNDVNIQEQQKSGCTGNCGTGVYDYSVPKVNKHGVRAIAGRIDAQYSTVESSYLTPKENRSVDPTGTNGRIIRRAQ